MRIYIVTPILAFLCLLPFTSQVMDFSLGSFGVWLNIPYTGLDYMRVFFHELGHCATFWVFGYPSVPSFDFTYGGGVTFPLGGRVWPVQWAVFAGFAGVLVFLFRRDGFLLDNERRPLILFALVIIALHLSLAFNKGHDVLISFMGYGAEVGIALFCIARAALKMTHYGAAERYLNMTFGLYVLCYNAIPLQGLVKSEVMRMAYSMQKGGEMAGDFEKIADTLNTTVSAVAAGSLVYMILMSLLAFIAILWWRRNEESGL